jgi:NhaP-type Na+/H+ or K+/H+ antiporter
MGRSFRDIFLLVFPLTGLLFGGMTYYLLNMKVLGMNGLLMAVGLGFACGLVFGIGIGYLVRSYEITVNIDPKVDIYTRLQLLLGQMGYRLGDQFQRVVIFEPTLRAGIFADRIRLEMLQGQIKLEGPNYHLDRIRTQLGV